MPTCATICDHGREQITVQPRLRWTTASTPAVRPRTDTCAGVKYIRLIQAECRVQMRSPDRVSMCVHEMCSVPTKHGTEVHCSQRQSLDRV